VSYQICPPNKGIRLGGWSSMKMTAIKYREFAEQCERLAEYAELKQYRAVLLEIAEAWKELAMEEEAAA